MLPLDTHCYKKLAYLTSLIEGEDEGRAPENLTLNNQQIMDCRTVTCLERAILLANFFIAANRYMGTPLDISLLMGLNSFGQRTVLVLRRMDSFWQLWNPSTADCLSFKQVPIQTGLFGFLGGQAKIKTEVIGQHDFEIPIVQVHQLVTPFNTLIYTGKDANFYAVDFDTTNADYWTPFLSR
jgi:hypothetical protein